MKVADSLIENKHPAEGAVFSEFTFEKQNTGPILIKHDELDSKIRTLNEKPK